MSRPTAWPAFIVDAFTFKPFGGNTAAVCLVDEQVTDDLMQQVAAEFGFSETAFVAPGLRAHRLRWFTPTAEVALCGHATLAAAAVLYERDPGSPPTLTFDTLSGPLLASRRDGGIMIELPRMRLIPTHLPPDAAAALGVDPMPCFRTPDRAGMDDWDYLVPLASETALHALSPDARTLASTRPGVIVTARADDTDRFDFVSRYFAPAWGIDEDPVTGSAHCALAPYWGERLGRSQMRAYQASRRGGMLDVVLLPETVQLTGHATIVMRGTLAV